MNGAAAPIAGGGQDYTLGDGRRIPRLGAGVWQIPTGRECVEAVRAALDAGYRLIDTAQAYGNEESVGRAVRESGQPRDSMFITTKFAPTGVDPVAELVASLRRLRLDYVDVYLVHWPQSGPTWAWSGMQKAQELGYARSIGISNFSVLEMNRLLSSATAVPVINQVKISPFEYRRQLVATARTRGVAVEAYSPLGAGRSLVHPTVIRLAEQIGRTPAQVILRWCIQHDLVVLTKSTHPGRLRENAQIFDFSLSARDMSELDALDQTGGTGRAVEEKWW